MHHLDDKSGMCIYCFLLNNRNLFDGHHFDFWRLDTWLNMYCGDLEAGALLRNVP